MCLLLQKLNDTWKYSQNPCQKKKKSISRFIDRLMLKKNYSCQFFLTI